MYSRKKLAALIGVFLLSAIVALYGTQSVKATGPHIGIGKFTNGDPADLPPGPMLNVGDPVEWRYYVINLGTVDLTTVTVVDDQGVEVTCPRDYLLAESGSLREMNCYGYGVAEAGQYMNVATACGEADGQQVCFSASSHYFGVEAAIDIEKATNGEDADTPTGPLIPVGEPVNWTYQVTNIGNVDLMDVTVVDDQGVAVTCPQNSLTAGESMTCLGNGIAQAGQNANIGKATGTSLLGKVVMDEDPSHYFGEEPQTGGGQGCTPGYWKQDQHFSFWVNHSTSDDFEATFGVNASFDKTLLGALKQGGGGEKALGRHAVAALLNASNSDVDYLYTANQVITMVQNAYASNSFEQIKDDLEAQNEAGCPLGNGKDDKDKGNKGKGKGKNKKGK